MDAPQPPGRALVLGPGNDDVPATAEARRIRVQCLRDPVSGICVVGEDDRLFRPERRARASDLATVGCLPRFP